MGVKTVSRTLSIEDGLIVWYFHYDIVLELHNPFVFKILSRPLVHVINSGYLSLQNMLLLRNVTQIDLKSMIQRISLLTTIVLLAVNCSRSDLGQAPVPDNYINELEEWKAERMVSLTNPTGWMRLAGMYFLGEGENRFGSGENVDIQFPGGTIPEYAGTITLQSGTVTMYVAAGVNISFEGEPIDQIVLYDGEETHAVEHETLEWLIIEREDLIAIRLYNKENQKVDDFEGFPRYETDTKWHLKAKYVPAEEGTTISIANVLGQQTDTPSPGHLEFMIDDKVYTLDALEGSTNLFIILGDETNRTETYQAGRYLYVEYPEEESDYTIIDFNKAYNPPCAYNMFTTCQLPPMQNRLETAITAGELRPVNWDGLESASF